LRRAFLDRFAYLADGESTADLLSEEYARARAKTISPERANPDARPGRAGALASVAGGDGCTTHLNVVDAERNMVACTSTLGELFGSGVVARGTGMVLNNGMTWFDPEPGHVNSIGPHKRILWAPTPTLVLGDGEPLLALG